MRPRITATALAAALTAPVCGVQGASSIAFQNAEYSKSAPTKQNGVSWPSLDTEKSTYVYVHTSDEIAQPTEFFFGSNVPVYVAGDFFNTDDMSTKMATAGQSFLRYPGGSSANKLLWDADYDSYPYFSGYSWMTADSKYSMEDFVVTINNTGATPLVELNAALSLVYGSDVGADYFIQMHEQLLAYGCDVAYYAFGNENYGGWEPPYGDYPVNGTLYGEAFLVAAKALKKAYPKIQIGFVGEYDYTSVADDSITPASAPAAASSQTSGPRRGASQPNLGVVIDDWMEDILSVDGAADAADFVVIHEYYFKTTSSVPTNVELLEEVGQLSDMRDGVADFFAEVVPEATVPPIILSEFNLVQLASAGCGATLQFINTIWHAEILGEAIQGGDVAALMSFSWADAAENCSNTGRGTRGDYGLVSYGSDTIEDGTPTTQFYAYALFNLAFGDSMVNSTISQGTSTKIKTYASTFSDGSVGIVIVNEDSAAHTMRFDGLTTGAITANGWVVASSDPDAEDPLSADGVTWNGETPDTFPLETSYTPYSASASEGEVLEVDVPAYSVTGIVVYY
eukprot:CAMPEP_0182571620 /NCGR_PEP_ID=MMETSP1324-20130603/14027_1 /TAXON_ID=236786 /ORGANISM="Florenciella sp., Strain RCC1587" /LENGTH=567 /DNA_ID=CAMNT_0024786287 /DNA_START=73 /DNA_END=1776 /DNA_ORIENTATION=+